MKQIYYVDLHAGNSETLAGNDSSSPQTWMPQMSQEPNPMLYSEAPCRVAAPLSSLSGHIRWSYISVGQQ